MKITTILIFAVLTQVSAAGYAQRVTLHQKAATLKQIFNEINKQTGYNILWSPKKVNNKVQDVQFSNAPLEDVLVACLKNFPLTYEIENKTIVIREKSIVNSTNFQDAVQFKNVQGKVTDEKGMPIPGASIKVKGTAKGTVSASDGTFVIDVVAGDILTITSLGFTPAEIAIADQNSLTVVLKDLSNELSGVVVTALGIKKQARSLSYNVQEVSGDELTKVKDPNFVNSLNGKVAGVTINSSSAGAGGSSRVVMRGSKSISGNNNALYVIDGIPMPNLSTEQPQDIFAGAGQTGDGISNLNSEDIESISVLSGPAAAALYGSAAANGVVLVTTKKGQNQKLSVNLTNNTTFSNPLILPKFQNTYGVSETGSYYSWGDKLQTPSTYKPADFFQTGRNITNSVSLSTGSDRNQTYVSFGTVNSEGIIHSNEYDRYNFSARNTSSFLDNKMTLDLGFMTSIVKEQNMIAQGQYFNPLIPIYLFPAGDDFQKVEIFERYDASRNFKTQFWQYGDLGFQAQNPYWITERDKFINHKDRYITNASLKYEVNNWINVSARAKMDKSNDKFENKYNASTNTLFASENGYYALNNGDTRQIYGEFLVNINKYFNDHKLNLTANVGANVEDVQYNQAKYSGKLLGVANLFTYANINSSTSDAIQTGYHKQKQAVFASAQLGYKSMAYLDVTGRNDWASTLAGATKGSFFYPSVGLSGILTDIFDFSSDLMPYVKLRASYSEVGNEPTQFLTIPTYPIANGFPVTQTRMPNPDLQPELTKAWELGLNLTFFKNKLKIDATTYKSSTYNQFFEPTLSSTSGFRSVIVNAGRVDNKGLEVSAKYNDTFAGVNWSTYLTYSLNRNKIVELLPSWTNPITGDVISLSEIDKAGTGGYKMTLKEGGTMGDIYVNTLRTDEHGAIYVNPSDQTVAANVNNFVYAGSNNPNYNVGWGNSFNWKGISASFLFTARVGGIVVSNTQAAMDAFGISQASADARNAGGALVNGERIPAKEYYQVIGGGSEGGISSMYVYSATNVRLAEATLGYDIPTKKWAGWIKGINVALTGRNLFFLYNRAPYDPELTANTGTYFQGIDYFMSPSLRNIGFSVKVQF